MPYVMQAVNLGTLSIGDSAARLRARGGRFFEKKHPSCGSGKKLLLRGALCPSEICKKVFVYLPPKQILNTRIILSYLIEIAFPLFLPPWLTGTALYGKLLPKGW